MFEVLAAYLMEKAEVTAEQLQRIRACTTPKQLRKKRYLLHEGAICHRTCFVARGCLRMYRIGEDGTEHILRFAIENWWMSDQESYHNNTPSKNNIDALEDSDLLLIEKEDFENLVNDFPNFRDWRDRLKAKSYVVNQNRILSNISDSAEVRYLNFVNTYPDVYNRVPLHMVASFLGVSRETLSRIRNQYAKAPPHSL